MKATNVTIDCTVFAPGELDIAPSGGCGCEVIATFPGGGEITRSTGVYSNEKFARGVASNIKHNLESLDVRDVADARRQLAIKELGY